MKFPAILACCAILALWATPAVGAEMPKDLIGSWCHEGPGPSRVPEIYTRCKKGDEDLIIRRKSFNSDGHSCKPLRVTEQGNRTWIIEQRCHETTWARWEQKANFLYVTPVEPE